MRNLLTLTCLLAATSLSAAPALTDSDFSWAQGQLAFLSQENSACVKDSLGFGLGLGHWFKPRWGWEAAYLHSRLEQQNGLWKASEDHFDATILHRPFVNTGRWLPFLRAGAGLSRLENPLSLSGSTTTRLNLVASIGTQVILGERSLGTLELRSTTVESSARRQEVAALVGFGIRWGGTAPAPVRPSAPPPTPELAPALVPVPPAPEPVVAPAPAPPPPPIPVVVPPAPVPAPLPAKIVLGDAVLHFANNGDQLGPDAIQAIEVVARQLKAYPGEYSLVVGGHTSSLGSKAHNKALSLRRAQSVAKVLVDSGIPAAKVAAEGFGPDQPVADNKTRAGQSRNRRVEIDVKTPQAVEKTRTDTEVVDAPIQPKLPTKAPAKAVKARKAKPKA